jgi:uncharacterized protein YhbP (UPF0306 family)
MEKRITDFIKKHHVLTLATSFEGLPWVANCFYAYMEEENKLVFTSSRATKHIKDLEGGDVVAASIVLETSVVGKIQGIQLRGRLCEPEGEAIKTARTAYLKRFPFAALMETTLWVLEVEYVKMTDNRLGFGKKVVWEKGLNKSNCK